MDFEKNAKRYYYQSLPSDTGISFRIPKELRDDFVNLPNSPSISTVVKAFLIDYVLYNTVKKDNE